MSTAAAPALETAGGSSTPASDPIDALDLSTLDTGTDLDTSDAELPESMILGSRRADPIAPTEDDVAAQAAAEAEAGRVRGPDGKFTKKGEAKGEAPKDGKEGEVAPAPVTSPFRYRAVNETHELEGATVNEAGDVVIPAAKSGTLREAFNALHVVKGQLGPLLNEKNAEVTTLRQRMAEMETARGENETKAGALVDMIAGVMNEADDQKAANMLWALRTNWPALMAKADAEYSKAELARVKKMMEQGKAPEAARQPEQHPQHPQSTDAQFAAVAKATTRNYVEELKVRHEFRDLAADDWKQIDAEIERTPLAFLRPATAQDVTQYGVQAGQTVFDRDLVNERIAARRTAAKQARETAADAARLAADNARLTQPRVKTPPNAGGGTHAPRTTGTGFTNKQDVEAWWDSDEI